MKQHYDHSGHLVAVLEILIKSHNLHLLMEVAQLSQTCSCSNFLFFLSTLRLHICVGLKEANSIFDEDDDM